jgi:Fic-DOC domain mobile mystery protein B
MNEGFYYPDGASPLTNDEFYDLIPKHVTNQQELNAVEQMNIAQATLWLGQKKRKTDDILNERFLRQLHRRLFGSVWKWAGKFRQSDKNIGVDWLEVSVCLRNLFDDVKFHIEHGVYSIDEIAARFHHRLVFIHPFPNGNGRHARVMAEQLLKSCGEDIFTWGGGTIQSYSSQNAIRKEYIRCLREADKGSIEELLKFVRVEG